MRTLLLFALLCGATLAEAPYSGSITLAQPTPNGSKLYTIIGEYPKDSASVYIITKQEAQDVVKAMEIFTAPEPSVFTPEETSVMYATNPPIIENSADSPAGLRRRADWLEKIAVAREQRAKDLAWARSILENWKKKIEQTK